MQKGIIIGAGDRGNIYASYAKNVCEIVGICEPDAAKRVQIIKDHNPQYVFDTYQDLFALEKIADFIIISTQDRMHIEPLSLALKKGYHVLLEKPMAPTLEECEKIVFLQKKYPQSIVLVSHVLRYTPFFKKIKELIKNEKIGSIQHINHLEEVGYFHFAHSYVRGNWRKESTSSPFILAKASHDLDLIQWLIEQKPISISSAGSLSYFTEKNYPKNATSNECTKCAIAGTCPYSATRIYQDADSHFAKKILRMTNTKNIPEALAISNYGKCVFKLDNDVPDSQTVMITFENNKTATLTATAFSENMSRELVIYGSLGTIRASLHNTTITISVFGEKTENVHLDITDKSGHGGGDKRCLEEFIATIESKNAKDVTNVYDSFISHKLAFLAEHSRKTGTIVKWDQ